MVKIAILSYRVIIPGFNIIEMERDELGIGLMEDDHPIEPSAPKD